MSIDFDWQKLDPALSYSIVGFLNRHLSTIPRPSFIGPVTVTSLDFGTLPPDVEIVDVRDIYPEFLEDDLEEVERRAAREREEAQYQHLPPHMRYGREAFGMPAVQSPSEPPWHQVRPLSSPSADPSPSLQIHLRLIHHSDLRLTLSTALIINYPSPEFLSLPIKLHLTSFLFTGEFVLAYEGMPGKRRLHFCILDELDSTMRPHPLAEQPLASFAEKPPPIGVRLLPQIVIESEIGDADKHALKNVSRVERFIQDSIRTIVEEELVFPSFHTVEFD